ncbi:CD276 antigen homolog isoform X2 [Amphiprion ocellaris]|uniref:CD276 antigen homolog isoform X2 n=2 Tax=Amphiprion ocellaris TaxID=80972 RepID=UPI000C314D60|nr:CD276 antigen homolog isoform X2 [Amphiprion ocellaris]
MKYEGLNDSWRRRRRWMSDTGSFTFWMLIWSLNNVCGLDVEGSVGGSVVLPCIYSDPLPSSVSVYWRDKDDLSVLDIVKSSENRTSQHQRFRGRVSSFPQLYAKGNFSVEMRDLKPEDQGPYECEVLRVHFKRKVTLKVSDFLKVSPTRPSNTAADWSSNPRTVISALLVSGFILF